MLETVKNFKSALAQIFWFKKFVGGSQAGIFFEASQVILPHIHNQGPLLQDRDAAQLPVFKEDNKIEIIRCWPY